MKVPPLATLLSAFFLRYLGVERGVSPRVPRYDVLGGCRFPVGLRATRTIRSACASKPSRLIDWPSGVVPGRPPKKLPALRSPNKSGLHELSGSRASSHELR
jgi:hypothetical protein